MCRSADDPQLASRSRVRRRDEQPGESLLNSLKVRQLNVKTTYGCEKILTFGRIRHGTYP